MEATELESQRSYTRMQFISWAEIIDDLNTVYFKKYSLFSKCLYFGGLLAIHQCHVAFSISYLW